MRYTVRQLIAKLKEFPEDTIVLVEGYEDGFSDIGAIKKSQIHLDKNVRDYEGPYAQIDDDGQLAILLIRGPNPNAD
jgi:hypothetical protein